MSDSSPSQDDAAVSEPGNLSGVAHEDALERYGDDQISARHGHINGWLLVVYAIMFAWALYYAFNYWGGLGPGLDY